MPTPASRRGGRRRRRRRRWLARVEGDPKINATGNSTCMHPSALSRRRRMLRGLLAVVTQKNMISQKCRDQIIN